MKISVITVVYNNERTIDEAIQSVCSQDYDNIEYIIIDGNSTDRTKEIINKNLAHVSVLISEKDSGIYDAMNKGIKNATGEIVAILNSDDVYADTSVLSDIAKVFMADPTLDLVYGNLVYVKANDVNKIVRRWVSEPYHEKFFENGGVPPHTSLFIRKHVYDKVGSFDLSYRLAADYEFMLRIFKKYNYRSTYINRLIVKMRLGGATNQSVGNIVKGNLEILRSWTNNGLKPPLRLMPFRFAKRLLQFIK
jgi:glycosyltransferase involved in cell wall biosynthesis